MPLDSNGRGRGDNLNAHLEHLWGQALRFHKRAQTMESNQHSYLRQAKASGQQAVQQAIKLGVCLAQIREVCESSREFFKMCEDRGIAEGTARDRLLLAEYVPGATAKAFTTIGEALEHAAKTRDHIQHQRSAREAAEHRRAGNDKAASRARARADRARGRMARRAEKEAEDGLPFNMRSSRNLDYRLVVAEWLLRRLEIGDYDFENLRKAGDPRWREIAVALLSQDQGGLCGICKRDLPEDREEIELDHVDPASKGGSDRLFNLQAACAGCNREKGDNSQ